MAQLYSLTPEISIHGFGQFFSSRVVAHTTEVFSIGGGCCGHHCSHAASLPFPAVVHVKTDNHQFLIKATRIMTHITFMFVIFIENRYVGLVITFNGIATVQGSPPNLAAI